MSDNFDKTWIQTYSRKIFDLDNPQKDAVDIEHIARSLSGTNRFLAATKPFISVGQHSIFVADCLKRWGFSIPVQYAGLMHDAPEAYYGDLSRALKNLIMHRVKGFFDRIDAVVMEAMRVDISAPVKALVKSADNIACAVEARDLMRYGTVRDWHEQLGPIPAGIGIDWKPQPEEVQQKFLQLYEELRPC